MRPARPITLPLCVLAATLLAACAETPPVRPPPPPPVQVVLPRVAPTPPPPPPAPQGTADQVALEDGIKLYGAGNYNGAIKQLGGAGAIWHGGSKTNQLLALKYMAFSYCVTGRRTLCRRQFDKAFKLDRDFQLDAGENGHPLWGPVFLQAQKKR